VDTYKAEVAELAITTEPKSSTFPPLTFDAQIAKTVAQHDAGLILNTCGPPETWPSSAYA